MSWFSSHPWMFLAGRIPDNHNIYKPVYIFVYSYTETEVIGTMRKIAIINQKGGVGKTSTTVSLGAGLARRGKKVLIIDLDPQGNITASITEQDEAGIYEFLMSETRLEHCITHMGTNLDLLTSKENLHKAESMIMQKEKPSQFLKEKLSAIKGYDYILIDCAPSLGLLNQSILLFAKEAIIPVSTDFLGYDALEKMIAAIRDINEYYGHDLKISKIVPTMFDKRSKLSKEILGKISSKYFESATHPIRVCSKIKEAPKHKSSIFAYAKNSKSAHDYAELVKLVLQDEFEMSPETFKTADVGEEMHA